MQHVRGKILLPYNSNETNKVRNKSTSRKEPREIFYIGERWNALLHIYTREEIRIFHVHTEARDNIATMAQRTRAHQTPPPSRL